MGGLLGRAGRRAAKPGDLRGAREWEGKGTSETEGKGGRDDFSLPACGGSKGRGEIASPPSCLQGSPRRAAADAGDAAAAAADGWGMITAGGLAAAAGPGPGRGGWKSKMPAAVTRPGHRPPYRTSP